MQGFLLIRNSMGTVLCALFVIASPYFITHQWIFRSSMAEAKVIGLNASNDKNFVIEYETSEGETITEARHMHPKRSFLRGENATFYIFYDPQNPKAYLDLLTLLLIALAFTVGCAEVVSAFRTLLKKLRDQKCETWS